jgi:hypothetical protein
LAPLLALLSLARRHSAPQLALLLVVVLPPAQLRPQQLLQLRLQAQLLQWRPAHLLHHSALRLQQQQQQENWVLLLLLVQLLQAQLVAAAHPHLLPRALTLQHLLQPQLAPPRLHQQLLLLPLLLLVLLQQQLALLQCQHQQQVLWHLQERQPPRLLLLLEVVVALHPQQLNSQAVAHPQQDPLLLLPVLLHPHSAKARLQHVQLLLQQPQLYRLHLVALLLQQAQATQMAWLVRLRLQQFLAPLHPLLLLLLLLLPH